jgi:hypothetical protein
LTEDSSHISYVDDLLRLNFRSVMKLIWVCLNALLDIIWGIRNDCSAAWRWPPEEMVFKSAVLVNSVFQLLPIPILVTLKSFIWHVPFPYIGLLDILLVLEKQCFNFSTAIFVYFKVHQLDIRCQVLSAFLRIILADLSMSVNQGVFGSNVIIFYQ